MPAPHHRQDVKKQSESNEKWAVDGPESSLDYDTTDSSGPGNFKMRQVQRRYRSLFLQASREVYVECVCFSHAKSPYRLMYGMCSLLEKYGTHAIISSNLLCLASLSEPYVEKVREKRPYATTTKESNPGRKHRLLLAPRSIR